MKRSKEETRSRLLILFFVALLSCATAIEAQAKDGLTGAAPPSTLDAMRSDAQLADVAVVDAKTAWAVGDRGAIWHTADGGRSWNLQESGVDCRLSSVFFLDPQTGWAAGGYTQPYARETSGVVLRTRDGGNTWSQDQKLVLPVMQKLRFFDLKHGWAVGQSSAIFPTGVFLTEDGGRSWAALPASQAHGWLTGDFVNPTEGALAGRTSALATVRRRTVDMQPSDFGLRALRRMQLVAPNGGWLVGDGGLVLETRDLGQSWQAPQGELPDAPEKYFDFAALAVLGQNCWVAGTPGTFVFFSADRGQSWRRAATGQTLPIHALAFADEQHGWAVGELGVILATSDGGQTWRKQRAGGARSALACFFGRAADLPLELIAQLAADEGYLAAVEVLCRQDLENAGGAASDAAWLAHEAGVRSGASSAASAWRFPLRDPALRLSAEQLVETWNRAGDGQALEQLEAHVVARLRMWRPDVVFTSAANPRGADPLAHVVNQVVLRAVERAADPTQYPQQASEAGLQPWKVQKVYAALAGGASGTSNVDTTRLARRLGRSIGELAAPARGVLERGYAAPAANIGFRLLVDNLPQDVGRRDFFSGIALSPGGEARRKYEEFGEANLDNLRHEAQMRRNLQAIMNRAEAADPREGRLLADIGRQTRDMDPGRAAELVFQLAQRYDRAGRWELAAECFDLLLERYPNDSLAGPSLAWLVQYYASSEAGWRTRGAQQVTARNVTAEARLAPASPTDDESDPLRPARQASGVATTTRARRTGGVVRDLRAGDDRAARAIAYGKQLETLQPTLYGQPDVRFPLAVAERRQGMSRQAERFYFALRHGRPHDAWWLCAQTELWLAEPKGPAPKPRWSCAMASAKPRLDGNLDEPIWQSSRAVELHSALGDDAEWGAVALLAYDEEFLYLGISCRCAPGIAYEKSDAPRPRDSDLADYDRVELLLDVDRDGATYYRLLIDSRGWTGESCWGDKTWNPTWFVASGESDGAWTAEAAIPLTELAPETPTSKTVWAAGVQRIVPGVGFQSWTTPASSTGTPEGFGLLMFQ